MLLGFVDRAARWLQPFVGLRDGFFVVGAGTYFLGYIVWAFYAWIGHLGLLPLLSTQYITAGVIVGVFLMAGWLVSRGLWQLRAFLVSWLDPNVPWKLSIRWILSTVGGLALFVLMANLLFGGSDAVMISSFYVFAFSAFLAPAVRQLPQWVGSVVAHARQWPGSRYYQSFVAWLLQPSAGYVALGVLYGHFLSLVIPMAALAMALGAFYFVPQEFCGPFPRCARLDLDGQMLSKEVRVELTGDTQENGARVVRSVPLDILFSGGESVLVRRHALEPRKFGLVYEISTGIIKSKVQCA